MEGELICTEQEQENATKSGDNSGVDPASGMKTALNRRRPAWHHRLLAMTVIPFLFFVGAEVLLRVVGFGFPDAYFLKREENGKTVYVENLDFGRRFFPPGLKRAPLPLMVTAEKPARTYRIFVLGESAAMGFPNPSFSFSRILEAMLRNRFPDARFEVINTAMTAINSHVIVPIAEDCEAQHPDLFIVYMGNNEVVGPGGDPVFWARRAKP